MPTLNIKVIDKHCIEFSVMDEARVTFDSTAKELTFYLPPNYTAYIASDGNQLWGPWINWVNLDSDIKAISFGSRKEHVMITFTRDGSYEISAKFNGASWRTRGDRVLELVSDLARALSMSTEMEHVSLDISVLNAGHSQPMLDVLLKENNTLDLTLKAPKSMSYINLNTKGECFGYITPEHRVYKHDCRMGTHDYVFVMDVCQFQISIEHISDTRWKVVLENRLTNDPIWAIRVGTPAEVYNALVQAALHYPIFNYFMKLETKVSV